MRISATRGVAQQKSSFAVCWSILDEISSLMAANIHNAWPVEIRELPADDTHLAYAVMRELRPHIGSESEFAGRVNEVLRPGGYRLIASFDAGYAAEAAAAARFPIADMLAWGPYPFVGD